MTPWDITIHWSEEDGVFVAEVPELAGCMAHGRTESEAVAHVKEAVALWVDVARRAGDPIPVPRRRASA